jgi:hypothetical protein
LKNKVDIMAKHDKETGCGLLKTCLKYKFYPKCPDLVNCPLQDEVSPLGEKR